ncbi:MAG: hypothetical protein FJ398_02910 [Verrucomicrobia bacterium]|nr:hypothetical protein [Verrucomicrobiota bacterium]
MSRRNEPNPVTPPVNDSEPNNAFLCSRLGNLFRACGKTAWASEWFERTLRLDPSDIEARHHLFSMAADAEDIPAAFDHALRLVKDLSDGKQAEKPELTEALAVDFVEILRGAPDEFRDLAAAEASKTPATLEARFLLSLLEAEGDEDEMIDDAVERLLNGDIQTLPATMPTKESDDELEPAVELIPSLQELVIAQGLKAEKLQLALEVNEGQKQVRVLDRRSVPLYDGEKAVFWEAPPLREMFRGGRQPPPDSEMNRYPPEYSLYFYLIENHVLLLSDQIGDRTDQELEEVYSLLRRRPDGKSLGTVHDALWQAAALLLGTYALSQAEFEAIFGQLARSARHWAQSPISRNYLGYLRKTFGGESPD